MQQLVDSFENSRYLHHAYFLVGEKDGLFSELLLFLENNVGIKTHGNPDFWFGKFDNLTIAEAREISESSLKKDFGGSRKVFVIQTDFISQEAQNSLLKVFEEPTEGTHFFIISPQDILLPTLRSRMQVFSHTDSAEQTKPVSILGLSLSDRLTKVKKITEAISDEEGTKQDAISFVNQIENEIYSRGIENNSEQLELCQKTREALFDRGAPVKIVLENLVLSI